MKKSRRPTESEFPLIEVLAFPADARPLSIILPAEFELTGEVSVSMGAGSDQLEEVQRLLKFVTEAIADELWLRSHVKTVDPPFETGKPSQGGQPE